VNLRKAIGFQKLIYTPGLGSPQHIALLVYCGVDLFDSVPLILNARLENFLTADGKVNKDEIEEAFCYCPSCLHKKTDHDSILTHNYYASLSEKLDYVLGVLRKHPNGVSECELTRITGFEENELGKILGSLTKC